MKTITLQNRINKSHNKNGEAPKNEKYSNALKVLQGKRVYYAYSGYSKGWAHVTLHNPSEYLNLWGIDFVTGNDAPRGGKNGDFIELSEKGKRQCKEFIVKYLETSKAAEIAKQLQIKELETAKTERELAIKNEAESIIIDQKFKTEVNEAFKTTGGEKSHLLISATKGLLLRNNHAEIATDYWKVCRILYNTARNITV